MDEAQQERSERLMAAHSIVNSVRDRARTAAALVATMSGAIVAGLLLNLETRTLFGPAVWIAVGAATALLASVWLLLRASLTTQPEKIDVDKDLAKAVDDLVERISHRTTWALRVLGWGLITLALMAPAIAFAPREHVRVLMVGEVHDLLGAVCPSAGGVITGLARSRDIASGSESLALEVEAGSCGASRAGTIWIPRSAIAAIMPADTTR